MLICAHRGSCSLISLTASRFTVVHNRLRVTARFVPILRCCSDSSAANQSLVLTSTPVLRRRPPGGGRFLTDPNKVFDFNNWDNVEWDEEQEADARLKVDSNSKQRVPEEKLLDYEENADRYWNDFYEQHQNRFFKDRHWLFTEFPELARSPVADVVGQDPVEQPSSEADGGMVSNDFPGYMATMRMLEVGCGVGNTIIPILQTNNDPNLFVYGCDLSSTAIQLLKDHPEYDVHRCHAFVCDIADPDSVVPFPDASLDVIICIFVLSAIHPDKMPALAKRLAWLLKPGGLILFRDYGRYDLTQLRFKTGRCLGDNLYARGDGTKVYFFTQEELRSLFVDNAGLVEQQNLIDRRLQVNRGRQIKMYRVWIQGKFRKNMVEAAPMAASASTTSGLPVCPSNVDGDSQGARDNTSCKTADLDCIDRRKLTDAGCVENSPS